MNHTIKGILIVAAIASMLVLGASMIPIMQNSFAKNKSDFKQAEGKHEATCNPSTVGGQTATLTDAECTATLSSGYTEPQKDTFQNDCLSIQHSNFVHEPNGDLGCIFPAYTISDMSYPYRINTNPDSYSWIALLHAES
jgi:hypothetical protein